MQCSFGFITLCTTAFSPNSPQPPENQEKRKQYQVGQNRSKRKQAQGIPDMRMMDKILESGEQSKPGERQDEVEAGDRHILLQIMGQMS